VTITLPAEDRFTITKEFAEAMILYAMGGRAAEELIFNIKTTGASNDIEKATDIARKMVCNWGMSDRIGPLAVGKKEDEEIFLGRGVSPSNNFSQHVAQTIDEEIHRIVTDSYTKALNILRENKNKLVGLAEALLIKETLNSSEMSRILAGEDIVTEEELVAYNKRKEVAKNWQVNPEIVEKATVLNPGTELPAVS